MSEHGMKSAEEWLKQMPDLDNPKCDQNEACICERCKNGREIFLLPSDIRAIQLNALEAAAKVANECKADKAWKGAIGSHVYVCGCNNVQLAILSLAETIKGGK